MMETWHPLGVTGVISAFNFPVAVWSWNAALAFVCGDASSGSRRKRRRSPRLRRGPCSTAALARFGSGPGARRLSSVILGGARAGEALVDDHACRSSPRPARPRWDARLRPRLASRFARSILELGGNNAAIVCPSADLDLALRAIAFAAMGTAGQRCTPCGVCSCTRACMIASCAPEARLCFRDIGDPREPGTLVGPLIDGQRLDRHAAALEAEALAGRKRNGGAARDGGRTRGRFYVRPALVEMPAQSGPVPRETFAPILYVMRYRGLGEAIRLHNDVSPGLSSSIFTRDLREAELFLSAPAPIAASPT